MVRGAIIGFGGQGKAHFQAMKAAGIEVVGVCDINPDAFIPKRRERAWQGGHTPYLGPGDTPRYVDWHEMITKEQPEIVGVATWTSAHAAAVIDAAHCPSVKAILCEKPIANQLAAARRMIETCAERNVLLAVNCYRAWWPEHRRVKRCLEEGVIGKISSVAISCGGARLGDIAPHLLHWARWMIGNAVSVIGKLDPIEESNPRDPDGMQGFADHPGWMLLTFANGVPCLIDVGQGMALPPLYRITGRRGYISVQEGGIDGVDRWEVRVRPEAHELSGTRDYYGRLAALDFPITGAWHTPTFLIAALRELLDGKISSSGEDGYRALECLVAAHLSHERGNVPIALPLKEEDLERKLPIA